MIKFSDSGYWQRDQGDSRWTLVVAGDCCPIGRIESAFKSGQPEQILSSDILELFSGASQTLVNLEAPLCKNNTPILKTGPNFRVTPEVALGLKVAGINCVSLANNHIMDQGVIGLEETLRTLEQNDILFHGAGLSHKAACQPLCREFSGQKVTFLNFAEGEFARCQDNGPGAARLDLVENIPLVRQAAADSDIVIVSIHGGNEYQFYPSPYAQKIYRKIIDAGAHLILAHHPHIPQGIEEYNGGIIIYSLGNFLFDFYESNIIYKSMKDYLSGRQNSQQKYGTRVSFLVEVSFGAKGIVSLSIHPFKKDGDARVLLLSKEQKAIFTHYLNEISTPLSDLKKLTELWEQEVIILFNVYSRHFKNWSNGVASKNREQGHRAAGALYNIFRTDAHREVFKTAFQLIYEKRFSGSEATINHFNRLGELLKRLVA